MASGRMGPREIDTRRVYTGNLRSARQTDTYLRAAGTVGAESAEFYFPRMTYHGFRYVEVHGWPDEGEPLAKTDLVLLHSHSNLERRTDVAFPSQPVLAATYRMAVGAQQSNLMTVATDCPQRDERLAWTGDLALSADSMALNFEFRDFARSSLEVSLWSLWRSGSMSPSLSLLL